MSDTTHFGFKDIPVNEKVEAVGEVFKRVAPKYDLMNDLMSFGVHRIWKRIAIEFAGLKPGQRVLDLASGSGDLALQMAKKVGKTGHVTLSDINPAMLALGRENLEKHGIIANADYVIANAENLPFADNHFDCITISFGLRNVTDKDAALRSMQRVLRPGGRLLVLEFSKPVSKLFSKIYDAYSFNIVPKMGEWVLNDRDSYEYLVESIRMHPSQEELRQMALNAGFDNCDYYNMTGGVVALHRAYKY